MFHAETGGYDVELSDDRSPSRPMGKPVRRTFYRYQIQGPNAWEILTKLNGGPIPEVRFFNMGAHPYRRPRGSRVTSRHVRRARARGVGPYDEGDEIRAAIIDAGRDLGLAASRRARYATNTLESGWIPSPAAGDLTPATS